MIELCKPIVCLCCCIVWSVRRTTYKLTMIIRWLLHCVKCTLYTVQANPDYEMMENCDRRCASVSPEGTADQPMIDNQSTDRVWKICRIKYKTRFERIQAWKSFWCTVLRWNRSTFYWPGHSCLVNCTLHYGEVEKLSSKWSAWANNFPTIFCTKDATFSQIAVWTPQKWKQTCCWCLLRMILMS